MYLASWLQSACVCAPWRWGEGGLCGLKGKYKAHKAGRAGKARRARNLLSWLTLRRAKPPGSYFSSPTCGAVAPPLPPSLPPWAEAEPRYGKPASRSEELRLSCLEVSAGETKKEQPPPPSKKAESCRVCANGG